MSFPLMARINLGVLLLDEAVEATLLVGGLEATVTELRGGIDELESDLLEGRAVALGEQGLAESQHLTLGTDDAALDHDVLLVDDTVVRESTERGDGLLGKIVLGHGVVGVLLKGLADLVDLLVHLSTVMITVLTSAGDLELHTGRMPGTDTGNLAETTMGLTREAGNTPTSGDTLVTLTLGNTDDINALVLLEDGVDGDLLFEELGGEVDLVGDGATVDLDLKDVGLLLSLELGLGDLGVADGADDLAVLLHAGKLRLHLVVLSVLLLVVGEGLVLGLVPVLVEATLALIGQMVGPDGGEGAETGGGLDVADDTDADHRGGLDDGDGLDDLLLVELGAGLLDITEDMSHTGLEAHEGGQVARLGGIIGREGLDLTLVMLGTLAGQETQRAVAGCFEFTMRHCEREVDFSVF